MDKKLITKICLVCVMTMAGGTAYAANFSGTTDLGGTFSTSNRVTISIASSADNWAAYSQHLNGDRVFWGSNTDSKIYYGTKATGTTSSVTPTATMTAPYTNSL